MSGCWFLIRILASAIVNLISVSSHSIHNLLPFQASELNWYGTTLTSRLDLIRFDIISHLLFDDVNIVGIRTPRIL